MHRLKVRDWHIYINNVDFFSTSFFSYIYLVVVVVVSLVPHIILNTTHTKIPPFFNSLAKFYIKKILFFIASQRARISRVHIKIL